MPKDNRKKRESLIKENPFCAYCHGSRNLTLDHIKPKAAGGNLNKSNLQLLCGLCNTIKGCKYFKSRSEFIKYLRKQVEKNKLGGEWLHHAKGILKFNSKNHSH